MASEHQDVFRLYLLRHAHAAWPSPGRSDFERVLDGKGLAEARSVALQAFTAGLSPERVVSSPARRCAETTAIFLEIFGNISARYDERLYSEGIEVYLEHIRENQAAKSLLLVGHNPMIEALATFLAVKGEAGQGLSLGYPTAGFLALDFRRPLSGDLTHRGEPVLLLTPALT
jgi:phosphohistidine phosphatase